MVLFHKPDQNFLDRVIAAEIEVPLPAFVRFESKTGNGRIFLLLHNSVWSLNSLQLHICALVLSIFVLCLKQANLAPPPLSQLSSDWLLFTKRRWSLVMSHRSKGWKNCVELSVWSSLKAELVVHACTYTDLMWSVGCVCSESPEPGVGVTPGSTLLGGFQKI